ncbi:MAG: hypothetical protein CSA50_01680 [Gammaproteobacteria bacterium]|nr:MAG: hypothetical protein CSA50_01680 [Gammaproteobacteria bacterium]
MSKTDTGDQPLAIQIDFLVAAYREEQRLASADPEKSCLKTQRASTLLPYQIAIPYCSGTN